MNIRNFQMEDYETVTALWNAVGLQTSRTDTRGGLEHKLERDADLFLVAEEDNIVIGAIMGSYDGRRGWINHLAVLPTFQGHNVGSRLLREVEHRLVLKGCNKVNLLIEPTNAHVQDFYARAGYETDPLIFMEKWL